MKSYRRKSVLMTTFQSESKGTSTPTTQRKLEVFVLCSLKKCSSMRVTEKKVSICDRVTGLWEMEKGHVICWVQIHFQSKRRIRIKRAADEMLHPPHRVQKSVGTVLQPGVSSVGQIYVSNVTISWLSAYTELPDFSINKLFFPKDMAIFQDDSTRINQAKIKNGWFRKQEA